MALEPLPKIPGLKFATQRDNSRPTLGARQDAWATIWLGQPFMPWQRFVSDVAGEIDPKTGLPAHDLVVCTVQRQAGKSHMAMGQTGERCFSRSKFRAWYTAQTGGDAADQFLKFQDDVVADTPLDKVVRTLRGNGHQVMKFPNGSALRPYPPTEGALHGKQADRVDIDEAWAFPKEVGTALLAAGGPTQLTRAASQFFIWSAGGTANSTWLAELVARGRAGDPSLCYFEFGVPDDMEINDLDGIARHHPAYGHTFGDEGIPKLRKLLTDDAEFIRAAGNRWTEIIGGAISASTWATVQHRPAIPDGVPLGFGVARAEDGSHVAIAAAAQVNGFVLVELLDLVPAFGADKIIKTLTRGSDVAVQPTGPSGPLADDLVRARIPRLMQLSDRDAAAACAQLLDGLPYRATRFRPNAALDEAVKVAAKRRVGDGGYAWSRIAAGPSIAAMEAATLARWALTHKRTGKPATHHQRNAA